MDALQGSLVFMQAAAVGWSHTAVLRHIIAGALKRARLSPLPPPVEPVARDPETLAQGEDLPGSVLAHFTNTTQEMQAVHGDDWPATWEEEDGHTAGSNVWRQPGCVLDEQKPDARDALVDSRTTAGQRGQLHALREMVTSGKDTHFEEVEDDAFAELLDEWTPDEIDLQTQDVHAAFQPLEHLGGIYIEQAQSPSICERATLQGVSAIELGEQDMERLVEEMGQEAQADEEGVLASQGFARLGDLSGSLCADAGSSTAGGRAPVVHGDMMGDLAEEAMSQCQQNQPHVGDDGAAGQRQKVYVLCGGDSSERNVSLQSGVTVCSAGHNSA